MYFCQIMTHERSTIMLIGGLLLLVALAEEMKSADRALYSLLFTLAEHKNQIPHTKDSLIRIAVNYYKDGNDKERESKVYYYLGCV